MTQRMIEITSPAFISEERLSSLPDLAAVFETARPLALEIGCGIGDFIVQLAGQRRETNFLAIDIYNKGCHKTCKKVDAAGLENVRVLRAEARFLMTHHLAAESLEAIYINCPDPWPKKRHRGRRLVNGEFLQMALHSLRPDGELYFSSDFTDYAQQVAELLADQAAFRNCLEVPMATELPGYPLSKYMRRFLDLGQPIHFIHYRKAQQVSAETASPPEVRRGFRVRWSKAGNE